MRELTQRQEIFTLNLFKGMTQRAAYIDAYKPTYSISSIDENASRLSSNEKVIERLKELNEAREDSSISTVEERKKVFLESLEKRGFAAIHNGSLSQHAPRGIPDIEVYNEKYHINVEATKTTKSGSDREYLSIKEHLEKTKDKFPNKMCFVSICRH